MPCRFQRIQLLANPGCGDAKATGQLRSRRRPVGQQAADNPFLSAGFQFHNSIVA
jgi:hypothetical protein